LVWVKSLVMRTVKWPALIVVVACSNPPRAPAPPPAAAPAVPVPGAPAFRLSVCSAAPIKLEGPPDAEQSRGCVATFAQRVGSEDRERRYLVYAPANLPERPVPVVLVFPGYSVSAEGAAFYDTHTRFESLADRDGFVVVYGNGLPDPPSPRERASVPRGGFLQGCFLPHADEGVDVTYVRRILEEVARDVPIDRTRIYATGLSAGGGLAFQLALEAPDLVAAIAPVVPLPFQPTGPWLHACHARAGHELVSIAIVAATDDPFISYGPGNSREYPDAHYPGMEATRDAWLAALALSGPPEVDQLPDLVQGDSYEPDTHRTTSTIQRQRYRPGPDGRELWFYQAVGMGHSWPNPTQTWSGGWSRFGKTNQDIDFADEAWAFFKRHAKSG
jgi:polyhydroxybutyrate depolymerase